MIDLTPKFKGLKTAEQELQLQPGELQMGQRIGGVSMFSNAFKRGYGEAVFGADENGIWLGSADFVNGKFKVDMQGNMTITGDEDSSYLSAEVLIFYNNDVPEIVIGDPSAAP